jgi:phosphoserine phosphatase
LRKQLQTSDVTWMPNTIIADTKLTPGAKFLYSVLLNQSWRTTVVSPSHQALAREIGAPVRATRNYVDELSHAKLITLQARPGKPNLYSIARP